jgi:hypothetical protein
MRDVNAASAAFRLRAVAGELFSERSGRSRPFSTDAFAELIWHSVATLRDGRYFQEALGSSFESPRLKDSEAVFLRRLRHRDVHPALQTPRFRLHEDVPPRSWIADPDVIFDTLELLYADVVSAPRVTDVEANGDEVLAYDRSDGREALRNAVNPDLALYDPPMELLENGQIVASAPGTLGPLLDDPVPVDVPAPLRVPLEEAIAEFRARGVTDYDKRSALKHLADVLEPLRDQIDESILHADTSAIFHIANRFWLRHNDRDQMRGYDSEIWLDWIFYVYVATARALLATYDRQVLAESVFGPEPDDNGGLQL